MRRMTDEELLGAAENMRERAGELDRAGLAEELRTNAGALEELILARKLLTWVGYDGWQVPDYVSDLVDYVSGEDPSDGAWYPPRYGPHPRPRTLEELSPAERTVATFERVVARMARYHGLRLEDAHGEARSFAAVRPFPWGNVLVNPYPSMVGMITPEELAEGIARRDALERQRRTALARALGAGR